MESTLNVDDTAIATIRGNRLNQLSPSLLQLDKDTAQKLLLFIIASEEQQKQEQEDFQNAFRLEKDGFEQKHKRQRDALQARFEQLQAEEEDLTDMERCRFKRARVSAASVSAAISTQQNVQRRLWVRDRSEAWWERCNDPSFPESEFKAAFRMSRSTFDKICEELGASVAKEDTTLRQAIPVRKRVAVCIWRLATGEPLRIVSKNFGLGISTCHKLVLEVCAAINEVLLRKYIQWPSNQRGAIISGEFERISGIPDIIGSMYTTHIPIIAPKVNVASYYNRRHTEKNQKTSYSVTLQGVVDTDGIFTDVCIGWPGSHSDEEVLENSALYRRGLAGSLEGKWVVGGPSYPLLDWLLVPYPQQRLTWTDNNFNTRVEEVMKVSKNAFGRLKGRWRFLQKRAEVKLSELPTILGACCVLHNICEQYNEKYDSDSYNIQDDPMDAGKIPSAPGLLRKRDQIAHNLLHNIH